LKGSREEGELAGANFHWMLREEVNQFEAKNRLE
jgi:hypothetical protein